ncbi:MAG: c-type cytochrome [Pseudomonadota bacterium]
MKIRTTWSWKLLCSGGTVAFAILLLAARPLDGDPVHGAILFEKHCASCHGAEGKGGSAPALTQGGLINSLSDTAMLTMLRGGAREKGLHKGLKKGFALLDAWDVAGYLRNRVPHVGEMFPAADSYIVKTYKVDKYALDRLKKSLGYEVKPEQASGDVFALFDTGTGTPLQLVPQEPRLLDRLKRNMKVGYVVFMPFERPEGGEVQLAVALESKNLTIEKLLAMDRTGREDKDLNKQLSRFQGKGDRRLSGQPKARVAVGGGGKQLQNLEKSVTDVYLRVAELATAYEVEERERTWADDDVELSDPDPKGDDFNIK